MMKKLLYLLSSLHICLSSLAQSFDHIQMVQTWPATFCLDPKIDCIKPTPGVFTLHGLWPALASGNLMSNCVGKEENLTSVFNQLRVDLGKEWTNLIEGRRDDIFWRHEWNVHGICSQSNLSALQYFQKGIQQKKNLDLLNTLKLAKIVPSNNNNTVYKKTDIENAVKAVIGKQYNIYVSCFFKDDGTVVLFEIYVCLDVTATNYVSCPPKSATWGCGGKAKNEKIKFPTPSLQLDHASS